MTTFMIGSILLAGAGFMICFWLLADYVRPRSHFPRAVRVILGLLAGGMAALYCLVAAIAVNPSQMVYDRSLLLIYACLAGMGFVMATTPAYLVFFRRSPHYRSH